jgi:hypothetical protein
MASSFSGCRVIAFSLNSSICLASLKQLNRKDLEDSKEKSLRGLCGLCGSNSLKSTAIKPNNTIAGCSHRFGRGKLHEETHNIPFEKEPCASGICKKQSGGYANPLAIERPRVLGFGSSTLVDFER